MIKQYLAYKRNKIEQILKSSIISQTEKDRLEREYNAFMKRALRANADGRIVLDRAMSKEIMQLVRERKIPLVIDRSDMGILLDVDMPNARKGNPFRSLDDLVAVHKTPIPPVNDMVITPENGKFTKTLFFRDPSTRLDHAVPYVVGNDTIHFTLNCAVSNHEYGNDWDSYPYAVMIDFVKLNKAKILDVKSEDTYVDGNAELGTEYILFCPLGEREKMQKANPNAIIVEYDGINLNDAINCMILYSGRKVEKYGSFGWGRKTEISEECPDNKYLDELLEKEGYPNLKGEFGGLMHSETKYMSRRMWKREYEAIISLIEYNEQNGIEMDSGIMQLVLEVGGAYGLPGTVPVSVDIYKEYVLPILAKHGYDIPDDLFDGIDPKAKGMKYINHYPDPRFGGGLMPCVDCPSWETELRHRVINLVSSKNKRMSDGDDPKGSHK